MLSVGISAQHYCVEDFDGTLTYLFSQENIIFELNSDSFFTISQFFISCFFFNDSKLVGRNTMFLFMIFHI